MAQGRPSKWATARISEPIGLGKSGIEIIIWDKWGRTRRGTATIRVGGIWWRPHKSKNAKRVLTWNELDEMY